MNVSEKHRELAHAEIDGAVIQVESANGNWVNKLHCGWMDALDYRIDPKCDYALAKIPEKHMDVYLAWCDGTEIELKHPVDVEWMKNPINAPLAWYEHFSYRIKPKKVKRWMWNFISGNCVRLSGPFTDIEADSVRSIGAIIRKIPETEQEFDA